MNSQPPACFVLRRLMESLQPFTVVALLVDLPSYGLTRGQVGTVVNTHAPGVYEVDFSDNEGRTYAALALRADQLMALHSSFGGMM